MLYLRLSHDVGKSDLHTIFSVFCVESRTQARCNAIGCYLGVQFSEVHHTAAHRGDTVLLQFGRLRLKIAGQV